MHTDKLHFLTGESLQVIESFTAETIPAWGIMNTQEMVEHLADFYNISSGKIEVKLYTPEEQLPLYKTFLLSSKLFRENTKAPIELLGDKPEPLKFSSLADAKENLSNSVTSFIDHFKKNKTSTTLHPVFGELNFEEWVLLHYKHVIHHLKQFGHEAEIIA